MALKNDRLLILIVTCMAAFITLFLASSVNIALPSINVEFAVLDQALLNAVALGFLLSAAIFVVPFGRVADIFGRKTFFVAGLSIVVISSILCSISSSVYMLIASLAVEGLGSAMIFGTAVAILTAAYPAKERGRILGINVAITYLGLSLGPVIGGIITQNIGWRYIYAGITAYALLVALMAFFLVKDNERCAERGNFDVPGTALYAITLFSLILGLYMTLSLAGTLLIVGSFVVMGAFFWWELNHVNPILKVSIFMKNTVFMFSNMAALINYCATAAIAFLLVLYLHYIQGFTSQEAGLILVAQPIVTAIFSPITGRLSDKIEPRIVASAGMGALRHRPRPFRLPHAHDAAVPDHSEPDAPGPGVRPVLFAKHERHHELGRTVRLRSRVGHGEHHAPSRPDAEPGHRPAYFYADHRPYGDLQRIYGPAHVQYPDHVRRVRRRVHHRAVRLPGPG